MTLHTHTEIERALALIKKGKIIEGVAALTDAAKDPQLRQEALGHRAHCLKSLGRYEEAIADLDEFLRTRPEDADAATVHAELKALLGRYEESAAEAAQILSRNPLHHAALSLLVNCHAARGGGGN
ncbi:MAG: tetratricopeptide repeat protein [bacterium]